MTDRTELALIFASAFVVVGLLAYAFFEAMHFAATLIHQIFW